MITYKDKTFCLFSDCYKFFPSKCERVLTDYDLRNLRDGNYMLSSFAEKPECFEERKESKCHSETR